MLHRGKLSKAGQSRTLQNRKKTRRRRFGSTSLHNKQSNRLILRAFSVARERVAAPRVALKVAPCSTQADCPAEWKTAAPASAPQELSPASSSALAWISGAAPSRLAPPLYPFATPARKHRP